MKLNIAYLPGDGVGPEVGSAALEVLEAICAKYGHELALVTCPFGGAAIDETGEPLPAKTLKACQDADAVLLGAIGGPKWAAGKVRPEQGLLQLRKELQTFANLRPVRTYPALYDKAPLKNHLLENVDIVFLRELTGGIYFGDKKRDESSASDVCAYTVPEIERIIRMAAGIARDRDGRLTSVDKANVLETSRLWRDTAERVIADEFPDIELDHLYVDAAAMHLLSRPSSFDVIVTENMFGDILTDEASMLPGSMGMLPSASLGAGKAAIYEPIHGSAPDIAGQGIANPAGMILSVAMMLRYSFKLTQEADEIEAAVMKAMDSGQCTKDIGGSLNTAEAGQAITRIINDQKNRQALAG